VRIDAYQYTKPALRYRPVIVAGALLLGVGGLAVQMSRSRAADPLGSLIALPELGCSIRVPRGFVPHSVVVVPGWRIQPFEGIGIEWGHADLAVWYTRSDDMPGQDHVARAILKELGPEPKPGSAPDVLLEGADARIGVAHAYELQDPMAGLAVRVRKLPTGGYLAVSAVADGPIRQWLDAFDAMCRSVQTDP